MSGEAHLMRQALAGDRPARITRYLVATDGKIHELSGSMNALVEITFKTLMGGIAFSSREEALVQAEAYRVRRIAEVKTQIDQRNAELAHLEQLVFA